MKLLSLSMLITLCSFQITQSIERISDIDQACDDAKKNHDLCLNACRANGNRDAECQKQCDGRYKLVLAELLLEYQRRIAYNTAENQGFISRHKTV